MQSHPHWERVGWLPFASPPVRLRDVVANVVLFGPLGAAVAMNSAQGSMIRNAIVTAASVSLAAECIQLYSHSRFPSATDVAANVVGAAAAAAYLRARGAWRIEGASGK